MNNWRVETYDDPNYLYNNMKYEEDSLHIVATSAISMHLKSLENFKEHKNHVWTYANIQKAINERFESTINQVKMKVEIRGILEKLCSDKKIYKNLVHNINAILNDYKFYIHSGIYRLKECENVVSEEVKIVRKAFNIFCKSRLLNEIYCSNNIYNKESIIINLNKYYENILLKIYNKEERNKSNDINIIRRMYFYNLTYIDGTRFYFFKKMESIGIEIIFRIPHGGFSEPWERTYSFVSKENWCNISSILINDNNENKYITYLHGNYNEKSICDKRISLKEYIDPYEFKLKLQQYPIFQSNIQLKRWIKQTKNNYYNFHILKKDGNKFKKEREYLTFSKEIYNNIFNGTILEYRDRNSNFFYFNEGRFLQGLYNCKWDDNKEHINIDYRSYSECILSGWIEIKNKSNFISGKNASDLILDLKTYMNDVKSMDNILNRLYKLTYIQEFSNLYDDLSKNKTDGDKVKEYLQNPLKVFPYADNNRYELTVKQLIELTKKLKKYIEQLIPKDNMIELEEHKKQLIEYWKNISYIANIRHEYIQLRKEWKNNHNPNFKKYTNEHKQYLLFEDNLKVSDVTSLCTIEEVKEYMKVILKFSNDDEESNINNLNYIKIFDQIEGIMVNGTKEIYITDLSEKSIKEYAKNRRANICYGDEQTLKKDMTSLVNIYSLEEINTIIKQCTISNEEVLNFIKYYIGAVISFSSAQLIEFSWIKEINKNDQQSAIYKVLSILYGEKEQKKIYFMNKEKLLKKYKEHKDKIIGIESNSKSLYEINKSLNKKTNTTFHGDLSPMAWIDLDFCPRKFFYSSILNFYPVYESEFHQQIVFAIIGKLLKSQFKESKDVEKYFYYLFPQWNNTTKYNIVETSYKRDIRKEYKFKNIYFPYYAKDIQILRSKIYDNSRRRGSKDYRNMSIDSEKYIKEFIKSDVKYDTVDAKKGFHCSMCPYNMLCNKGEFAIERSNY